VEEKPEKMLNLRRGEKGREKGEEGSKGKREGGSEFYSPSRQPWTSAMDIN
jgi:hypothetical protein